MKNRILSAFLISSLLAIQTQILVKASSVMQGDEDLTLVTFSEGGGDLQVVTNDVTCANYLGGIRCDFNMEVHSTSDGGNLGRQLWTVEWDDPRELVDGKHTYYIMAVVNAPSTTYWYTDPHISIFSTGGLPFSTGSEPATGLGAVSTETSVDTALQYTEFGLTAHGGNATFSGFFIISPTPFDCQEYETLTPETFEIDPTLELPLGPEGDPADNQIYATETGEIYKVSTDGGPWNDGTTDHGKETAVSWDGETWIPFDELPWLCKDAEGALYIEAESDTFEIRVDDTAGNFADNINNPDPVTYTIAKAVFLARSCEDQYTYDPEADLVSSVVVPGDDELGTFVTDQLQREEWYAITVTSGAWQDDAAPPDRTDMQFKVDGDNHFNEDTDFHLLGDGEYGVGCQSTDGATWFIQAQNSDLYLRVNDVVAGFTANTGELNVSVYHAAFERNIQACEVDFSTYGDPLYDSVDASQVNGREFAYIPDDTNFTIGGTTGGRPGDHGITLVGGAFYILDTVDGPWFPRVGLASTTVGVARYDVAVTEDGETWVPLEDWTRPDCNVPLDALGHRRVVFQVPLNNIAWRIRVNDTETWENNSGFMGWNLYKAVSDSGEIGHHNPWIDCFENYNTTKLIDTSIPVIWMNGMYISSPHLVFGNGVPSMGTAALSVGSTYALTIMNGPWREPIIEGAEDRFDAAISSDDGDTWYALRDENPDVLCAMPDQARRYWTVVFTIKADQKWKIRVNDDDNWIANGGNLWFRLFSVEPKNDNTGSGPGNHPGNPRTGACALPPLLPIYSPGVAPDLPEEFLSIETLTYIGQLALNTIEGAIYYVSDWVDYASYSIKTFIAWCPHDTDMIMQLMSKFADKEPIATVNELNTVIGSIYQEVQGYNWDDEVVDTSIWTITGRDQIGAMIEERFFPQDQKAVNMWEGGDIVNKDDFNNGLPAYYYECNTVFTDYLPTHIRESVCFVNSYARETGLSFIMQMIFDIGGLIAVFAMFKKTAQEVIYMMTGVKPWTKSGALVMIERAAQGYADGRDSGGGGISGDPNFKSGSVWDLHERSNEQILERSEKHGANPELVALHWNDRKKRK